MVPSLSHSSLFKLISLIFLIFSSLFTNGQGQLKLSDLSSFKNPSSNWRNAGDVQADLSKNNTLIVSNGTGIIVNQPTESAYGHLVTPFEHGDLDVELDYMMAKGSNSGIYLQGRYEVQLFDSWGVLQPQSTDNGSIYQRWDDSKPEGQKGAWFMAAPENFLPGASI
jgi:Domain of Unknown Function (DUF1080)